MQYEAGAEKAAMIGGTYVAPVRPVLLADEPQIRRTRKILLIILGICLALCTIHMIRLLMGITSSDDTRTTWDKFMQVTESLIALCFYAFGVIVTYKYHVLGLRVCGWTGVALTIPTVIRLGFVIFEAGKFIRSMNSTEDDKGMAIAFSGMALVLAIIVIIVYLAVLALLAIIILLLFKLARLIDAHKNLATSSI